MTPEDEDTSLLGKEELDELKHAVAALRRSIDGRAAREAGEQRTALAWLDDELGTWGAQLREQLEGLDAWELFTDLRRRFAFFGARASTPGVDEFGCDRELIARLERWLDVLFDNYWRVQVSGAEHVPQEDRVLFVSNRSGVLPYDGLMIAHALARCFGPERRARFLVADWLAALPFAQPLLPRLGGVRACAENVERLLRDGQWVVAFPEGQKGALKLFHDRYRLQRFARGGFVSIAQREGAVIVPTAVVGAEEIHPVLYESRFASRLLGIPALVTPTFPHLGVLGLIPLPSQWRIRFGEPIRFDAADTDQADDPLYINAMTERIRGTIQRLLDQEVRKREGVFT
jgi:1-acyl-sn-glycerol-3-phosphate acyltransferase